MSNEFSSNTEPENWVDIPGYEGIYQVSPNGSIRSVSRIDALGRKWKSQIKKHHNHNGGYLSASLCKDGVKKHHLVHRLIASSFIENPESLPVVNHIDGNKHNNSLSNLEWCSYADNNKHAHKVGMNFISEKNRVVNSIRMKKQKPWLKRESVSNNPSGMPGIVREKTTGHWRVCIKRDGTAHYLGTYHALDDAIKSLQEFKQLNGFD